MGRLAIFQKLNRSLSDASQCARRGIVRFQDGLAYERQDSVIEEVQFCLHIDGMQGSTFTCSPWNIEELAIGRLFLDGTIRTIDDIRNLAVDYEHGRIDVELVGLWSAADDARDSRGNIILLGHAGDKAPGRHGHFAEASLEPVSSNLKLSSHDVCQGIAFFEESSALFHRTGGVHAAALVDGDGVVARLEDIGRHSAMDKLVGWCVKNRVAADDKFVVFSGRVPQEIVLKVIRLGCPVVVSPGAPTSLSVDLAERYGITLVGFAKKDRFNVYSHAERIVGAGSVAL